MDVQFDYNYDYLHLWKQLKNCNPLKLLYVHFIFLNLCHYVKVYNYLLKVICAVKKN